MVTMNWTKNAEGRLTLAWTAEDKNSINEKPTRTFHKAVPLMLKTRRPARRLLRALPLAALVS